MLEMIEQKHFIDSFENLVEITVSLHSERVSKVHKYCREMHFNSGKKSRTVTVRR